MELKRNGPNVTVLLLQDGSEILFSYATPVAVRCASGNFKTSSYYSRTTSKHVTQFLNGDVAQSVNQEVIDNFTKGAR